MSYELIRENVVDRRKKMQFKRERERKNSTENLTGDVDRRLTFGLKFS